MESKTLEIRGKTTHYLAHGKAGKTVVFLHGWGGSSESFRLLADELYMKSGWAIVALDLPGFGKSDAPDESGWNTEQYAQWLGEVVKALKLEQVVFYGHSFGCRVLLRYLARNKAVGVVLTGAAGIKMPLSLRARLAQALSKLQIQRIIPRKLRSLILRKIFKAHDWAEVSPAMKNTLKKTLSEEDLRPLLPKIGIPALILWGRHDSYVPIATAEIFRKELPSAELKIINDGRHGIHRTHRGMIVTELTNFLQKL